LESRVHVVLDQLAAKGGDIEQQEAYTKAVTGVRSTTVDVTSLWAIFVSWLISPEGGRLWVKQLLIFFVILLVTWILSRFVGRATGKLIDRHSGISNLLKDFAKKIAGRTVLFIGVMVALSALGVEVAPMLTAIGAGGFILAFALQETLGNFASGAMIMVYRPFDIGDYVSVAGVSGTVQRLSLVSTTLLTPDHKVLVIPNNKIWGDTITNATGNPTRRVDLVFGIGYDDDINKAVQVLQELATQHELTLDAPEPTIKVGELADSSVNLLCRPWVRTGDYWAVYWDLTRQVKDRFDAEGISIPFPQRDVHVYQSTPATN
jgi:small conductance mechanosensitive channel